MSELIDPEEKIRLLKSLLTKELSKTKTIAAQIHSKESDLAMLSLALQKFEKKRSGTREDLDSLIKELKDLIASLHEEWKPLSSALFPKTVNFLGLPGSLKQFIEDIELKENITIDFSETISGSLELAHLKQVSIYQLCVELIQFLVSRNNAIGMNIKVGDKMLEIMIVGIPENEGDTNTRAVSHFMESIKGILIWQEGSILPNTNWKNIFNFSFRAE